jgi:hypothetical protein
MVITILAKQDHLVGGGVTLVEELNDVVGTKFWTLLNCSRQGGKRHFERVTNPELNVFKLLKYFFHPMCLFASHFCYSELNYYRVYVRGFFLQQTDL